MEGCDASTGHLEVADEEDVAGYAVQVFASVAEAEDLQDLVVWTKGHCYGFRAAFFVRRAHASKDRPPSLSRLIPRVDRLASDRIGRWILVVEVILARLRLLQQFAATMAQKLVQTDLHLKGFVLVIVKNILVLRTDEGCGLLWRGSTEDVPEGYVLETFGLTDAIVVGDIDTGWNSRTGEGEDFEGGEIWCLYFHMS